MPRRARIRHDSCDVAVDPAGRVATRGALGSPGSERRVSRHSAGTWSLIAPASPTPVIFDEPTNGPVLQGRMGPLQLVRLDGLMNPSPVLERQAGWAERRFRSLCIRIRIAMANKEPITGMTTAISKVMSARNLPRL